MSELSGLGNTIFVVEHDRGVIQTADWIVELGPGGGQKGGEVVFSGERDKFLKENTLTARYIRGSESIRLPSVKKHRSGKDLSLHNATGNNLQSVDFNIPLQAMVAVTGVSGSGKSSLVVETLYRALARQFKIEHVFPLPYKSIDGTHMIRGVRLIDQAPIGRSPRSNPVTYLKIFDVIRRLFSEQTEAKTYGYEPGFFSFNVSGGRCENCKGAGYQRLEMYFFEDLYIKCEECSGKRYKPEALRVTYRGHNINDVLNMTVTEAIEFFHDSSKIKNKLLIMEEIGLGYLRLGQPATTLSGGEAQRLKICAEIINSPSNSSAKRVRGDMGKGILYILDEPTIGLHFRDISALLEILQRLVSTGNSVLIVEHNLDVIRASDWIIDLGPEGGERGGRVIFEGTPEDIIRSGDSHTGKSLREYRECLITEKQVK
jgi:excinuclease ABC subunit A